MTYIGTIIALVGFVLLWFDLMTGIVTLVIGFSLIWVNEDQKVKKKLQEKDTSEKIEEEFDAIKFEMPLSARTFELATLIYGSIDPYNTWLLKMVHDLESSFKNNPSETVKEVTNKENKIFKNLFINSEKYKDICDFLKILINILY